jgi:hypothetical protein
MFINIYFGGGYKNVIMSTTNQMQEQFTPQSDYTYDFTMCAEKAVSENKQFR